MRREDMWATGGIARTMVAFAACCAASATAATVTVNAPAGTSTNVTQVFSGTTAVAVNTGATGGTVRLSPHSTHTGGTTLSSGTDVQQESQLGGSLTLRGGNFRYSGPAGAVWTTAITNSAPNATVSQNWRIDSDLTMAGDMWSTDGLFVKTGPATLTLAAPFYLGAETSNLGSRTLFIDMSDDHAPTMGLSGATFAEGTVVVNTPYDTAATNKFSACSNTSILAVRTTNDVNEAALIVSNGITRTHAALVIGTGYAPSGSLFVKGRLEVSGGTLIVGNAGANILYTCVNNIPNDLRVEAVVDVSSEQQLRCKGYCPAYNKNTYSLTYVHDGGFFYNQDGSIVAGNTGTAPADASTTNDVVITGSGTHLICQNFENDRQKAGMTTNLRLADGGELAVTGALAPAANQDGYFYLTGALTVADRAVLDVSAFDDGEIAPGNRLFIAAAEGPITVPATLRVRPASKFTQPGMMAKTVIVDGCLYATFTSGGTAIIVR